MILSTRFHRPFHRPFHRALKLRVARDHELPGQDGGFRDAEARPQRDPDWAIREIVDEMMFEIAR